MHAPEHWSGSYGPAHWMCGIGYTFTHCSIAPSFLVTSPPSSPVQDYLRRPSGTVSLAPKC